MISSLRERDVKLTKRDVMCGTYLLRPELSLTSIRKREIIKDLTFLKKYAIIFIENEGQGKVTKTSLAALDMMESRLQMSFL